MRSTVSFKVQYICVWLFYRHVPSCTVTHRHVPSCTVTYRHAQSRTATQSRTVTYRHVPSRTGSPLHLTVDSEISHVSGNERKATCPFEMSADSLQNEWRHIPEDSKLETYVMNTVATARIFHSLGQGHRKRNSGQQIACRRQHKTAQ